MSEKLKKVMKAGQPVAEILGAGLALGVVGAAEITALHHRQKTHRSLSLHPLLVKLIEFDQRTVSVGNTEGWAGVHRIHHNVPDGTLKPFLDISRAVHWMEENMDKVPSAYVPDTFKGLDPFVDTFTLEEVVGIGDKAENFMRKRLGDKYVRPDGYTEEQLERLLHSGDPAYFYPDIEVGDDYTQDQVEHILLGDPHSPVRIAPPQMNGVRGVATHNLSLYRVASEMFNKRPDLLPDDLHPVDGKLRQATKAEIAAGVLIPAAAVLLRRGKYTPKDFAIALGVGAVIDVTRIGLMLAGSGMVNSLGHAGTLTDRELMKAIQKGVYKPQVNPDGSVTTNTEDAGIPGKILHALTLDEVGGQAEHHGYPEKIAYTDKTGWRAWVEAPWGSLLSALAHNKHFPLMNPGQGFDLKPGETRPDVPDPGMQMIHDIRAREYAKKMNSLN